ncbi:MAG: acyl-CoA dehydrogenase, partial [Actinobacteria bacterium]|nr:acyl-CoA dehydrogenase [Actinomycetota bacterium]
MTDLTAAAQAVSAAQKVVDAGIARLAEIGIDDNQVLAYDVAHAAAAVQTSQSLLDSYGPKGDVEARITVAFIADAVAEIAGKLFGREDDWGIDAAALDGTRAFVSAYRKPE